MQASPFDEVEFFRAVANSGARVVMIGRRALIALGMPVLTRDYDFWIPADDAEKLNLALRPLEMYPTRTPAEARANGRYIIEGDEHVDVLVARGVGTVDGTMGTVRGCVGAARRGRGGAGRAVGIACDRRLHLDEEIRSSPTRRG